MIRNRRFPDSVQQRCRQRHQTSIAVLADAIVESKGGETERLLTPKTRRRSHDEGCDPFADIANEQRKAALRQQRKEREERYAKMQADRFARMPRPVDGVKPAAPAAASGTTESRNPLLKEKERSNGRQNVIESIKALRERTGAGMMDCKHALEAKSRARINSISSSTMSLRSCSKKNPKTSKPPKP
jgi:ribosomal protein L7/L12